MGILRTDFCLPDNQGSSASTEALRLRSKAIRITLIDRIVADKPVEVDATLVANRVTGHEPPGVRVVVAMSQQIPALEVVVVAVLTPEVIK